MKSEAQIASQWRDYYSQQALMARDKAHYKAKAAEWTSRVRILLLDVVLAE